MRLITRCGTSSAEHSRQAAALNTAARSRYRRRASRPHLVVLCVAGATLAACHSATPPNIVLYVVDTLRFDALHCDGNTTVQTPAMDRMAREGTRFERAYANASWTRASMGSLLTGEYPTVHGAVGRPDALQPDLKTLAAQLRARGYRTAAIIANPNIGSTFGFASGFDEFIELYQPHPSRQPVRPEQLIATATEVVDRAGEWLAHNTATPFFLLLFTIDPHAPYTPPTPYNTRYDADYQGTVDGSFKSLFGLAMLGKTPPEREIRHLRALYDGEVAFNDAQLGRLLTTLDGRRLADSTLVVLAADHGEEFWEHGARDHGHTLFEELIHVPLIMRWPAAIPAGRVLGQPVQLADVYPTLIQLAGGTSAPGAGHDLSALLTRLGPGASPTAPVFAEEDLDGHQLAAVIAGSRKLIIDKARSAPLAFDLAHDPGELHPLPDGAPDLQSTLQAVEARNLAARPAAAARVDVPETVRDAMKALGYGDPDTHP